MDPEIEARLIALERKIDLVGCAVAELAAKAWPELDPLSPMHAARSVQAAASRYAANLLRTIEVFPVANAYADQERAQREREDINAQIERERLTPEQAEELNRKLALTHLEPRTFA